MKKLLILATMLLTFLSLTFFSFTQEIINVTETNSNLISFNVIENNELYTLDVPTISIPKAEFEPLIVDCNKCICIRVFGPTKRFGDRGKAVYFSHPCSAPCKGCSSAGGYSRMEWKAHYQRVYPEAQSVSIEGSTDPQTIKNCGCNRGL